MHRKAQVPVAHTSRATRPLSHSFHQQQRVSSPAAALPLVPATGKRTQPHGSIPGLERSAEKVLSFLLQTQSRSSVSASHRSHCSEPRLGAHTLLCLLSMPALRSLHSSQTSRNAPWVELSLQGLGDCELSQQQNEPRGLSPSLGRWVTATSHGQGRLQPGTRGHEGTWEEQSQPLQPPNPQMEATGAACLPLCNQAASSSVPKRERNQVSNVYEPIWRGWDAAQASAQKKVHILWYKYFGLPPPRQPTGSSTGTTTAALLRAVWQEADPHSYQCVLQQKPTHTDLGAHVPPRHCHEGERLLAEWSQAFSLWKVLLPKRPQQLLPLGPRRCQAAL